MSETPCGGRVATMRVDLGTDRTQLVGPVDSRQVTTVKADLNNDGPVLIVGDRSTPAAHGYPLYPGEGYALGGGTDNPRGAKAELWAWSPRGTKSGVVYVITEGI